MVTQTKPPQNPMSSEASTAAHITCMSSKSALNWTAEVEIGNKRYVVSPSFQVLLASIALFSSDGLKVISQCHNVSLSGPATVIRSGESQVTSSFLAQTVARFKKTDDVFHEAFLNTIVIVGAEMQNIDADISSLLSKWNARLSFAPTTGEQSEGPCYIIDGRCHAV